MFCEMSALRFEHFDVLWPVVVALSVQVVNDFFGTERSAEFLFSHKHGARDILTPSIGRSRMARRGHEHIAFVAHLSTFPAVGVGSR